MPAPPLKASLSGTPGPTRATHNAAMAELYDYVLGLLGATGNPAQARAALGLAQVATSGSAADLTTGNLAVARIVAALNAGGSAPLYACRAWARFSGQTSGSFAPASGGNVASIFRHSAGSYEVFFSTPMPDGAYAALAIANHSGANVWTQILSVNASSFTVNAANMGGGGATYTPIDPSALLIAVFR